MLGKLTSRFGLAALASMAGLAAAATLASPALAAEKYVDNTTFASHFEAAMKNTFYYEKESKLPTMERVAVDNSSSPSKGYIYVPVSGSTAGTGEGVIDKFEVTGSRSTVKVSFDCALGGSTIEAKDDPCVSGKQAPEAFTTIKQVAVGPNGEVFVTNANTAANDGEKLDEFNAAGEYVTQIKETTTAQLFHTLDGVAVAPDGDVYVGDYDNGTESFLDKFEPEGDSFKYAYSIKCGTKNETRTEGPGTVMEEKCGTEATVWALTADSGLAVNSAEDVYAASSDSTTADQGVFEFSSAGAYLGSYKPALRDESGVAVQPETSTNVFIGQKTKVEWYEGTTLKESIAVTQPEALPRTMSGIAVTSAGGLYIPEGSDDALQLFELEEPPAVGTCTGSVVSATEETLKGTVNPEGKATEYEFEYGTTTSYGSTSALADAGDGTTAEPESALVSGLTPGTEYHCRVYATNSGGEITGSGATFKTKNAVEGVTTGASSAVTQDDAQVAGSLKPEDSAVEYFFEYGTASVTEHATSAISCSSSSCETESQISAQATLSGLVPASTYHYRLLARREINGTLYSTDGAESTFKTKNAVEGVTTGTVSGISAEEATLQGTLAPEGMALEYFFEYGVSGVAEHATPAIACSQSACYSQTTLAASQLVPGLEPFTQYSYRLVARREIGGVVYADYGATDTFIATTRDPEILTESATQITPFSAAIEGQINAENASTSYWVAYGIGSTSERALLPPDTLGGYGATAISPQVLQGLAPDTEYHYKLIAESVFGTVEGPEQSFTTAAASAPSITLAPLGEIGQSTATGEIEIDPNGIATVYEVQLGFDGAFISVTAGSVGEGSEAEQIQFALGSLAAGSSYEVRVLAHSEAGESTSETQSFTTAPAPGAAVAQPATPILIPMPTIITTTKEQAGGSGKTKTRKKGASTTKKRKKALKACAKKPKRKRAMCKAQARKLEA